MSDPPTSPQSPGQHELWNDVFGGGWVRYHRDVDRFSGPFGRAAMARLDLHDHQRVLDAGCGCGDTTLELARAVEPSGSVLGVDLSAPMVEEARRYLAANGAANARVERGDLATMALDEPIDAVFSRFAVMFLPDPAATLAGWRDRLPDGGRIAFTTWQELERNEWMVVPVMAAASVAGFPPQPAPDEPGPFALSEPDRIAELVSAAGFRDLVIEPLEHVLTVEASEAHDFARWLAAVGPISMLVDDFSSEQGVAIVDAVAEAIAAQHHLRAAAWITSAVR